MGQGISLILNFFTFILAARFLGVQGFGEFGNLVAIVGILSKVVDYGLGPIVFRESSKNKNANRYLNSAIVIRLIIFLVTVVLLNFICYIIKLSTQEVVILNILSFSIIISTRMANIRELLATPFKVQLKMHYPMILTVLDNFLLLAFVIIMPFVNGGLFYFVIVYVISALPGFLLLIFLLYRKFGFKVRMKLFRTGWLLKESTPLAGFVLLIILFQQFDIVLLNSMKDSFAAGIYAAATRLSMPLNIIPTVIVTTVFPILVRNIKDKRKIVMINSLVYKVLFLISFVMFIFIAFKAQDIVAIVFGESYRLAGNPTMLLFCSQIFLFVNFFAIDLLTVHNKQFWNFVYSIILVLTNLSLNMLLIDKYSFNGVGTAKIISAFFGFLFLIFLQYKFQIQIKMITQNIIMWIFIVSGGMYFLSYLPLLYYISSSIALIFASVFLLKYFNAEEFRIIFKLINKEKWYKKIIKQ
ncbi:MAG: hypothetical protein A2V66_12755 [Ignavibacteria bacterium RBG_13_36_8]|nr:MAG: hypothetical protein A2V66_12755 [Ignavibacteria bacterium RBG_13_36_8]